MPVKNHPTWHAPCPQKALSQKRAFWKLDRQANSEADDRPVIDGTKHRRSGVMAVEPLTSTRSPEDIKVDAMRLQVRTLMIAVVVAAVVLGLAVHIRAVIRAEDDFAVLILMAEGMAGSIFLAIGLAVGSVWWIVREDDAYAARLRRRDIPSRGPSPLAESDPSAGGGAGVDGPGSAGGIRSRRGGRRRRRSGRA